MEQESRPELPTPPEPEPLLRLPLIAREEVGNTTTGWVPVYDIVSGQLLEADKELGWLHVPGVLLSDDAFGVQHPGNSLEDGYPRGSVVLLEPVDDPAEVEDGLTVLIDLGGQTDPDTGTRFAIRRWWPEFDESGELTGVMLSAQHTSPVAPLEVEDPSSVQLLGRFAGGITAEPT